MHEQYLEGWEKFAGGVMTLGFIGVAAIFARSGVNPYWAILPAVIFIGGSIHMFWVKRAQRVRARSLKKGFHVHRG